MTHYPQKGKKALDNARVRAQRQSVFANATMRAVSMNKTKKSKWPSLDFYDPTDFKASMKAILERPIPEINLKVD